VVVLLLLLLEAIGICNGQVVQLTVEPKSPAFNMERRADISCCVATENISCLAVLSSVMEQHIFDAVHLTGVIT